MDEQQIRKIVQEELQKVFGISKMTFQKHIQLLDARNIQVGKTNGTKIGTETAQKLGFFGKTPIAQPSAISAPTGGGTSVTNAIDVSARDAINTIRNHLTNLGLTA